MKKIIVAIDFSDLSKKVIETAIKFAKKFDSKLYVLYTEDGSLQNMDANLAGQSLGGSPSAGMGYNSGGAPTLIKFNDAGKETAHEMDIIKEHISEQGLNTEYMILDGNIEENIKREAKGIEADLIVLGSHKHGILTQLLFGEIGMSFISNCPCPVLIVPEEAK